MALIIKGAQRELGMKQQEAPVIKIPAAELYIKSFNHEGNQLEEEMMLGL